MIKILAVGDLHTKLSTLDRVISHLDEYDRIVFLGDYVDDWEASPEMSYNFLEKLIDLKLKNQSKIIILLGNHDLSEGWAGNFKCSGFSPMVHSLVKDFYKIKNETNAPIFQVAYSKGNYLFTHAGITNSFWKDTQLLIKNHYPELQDLLNLEGELASKISNVLNYALIKGLSNPDDQLFQSLGQVGASRGGWGTPSPLWADEIDLEANSVPKLNQIVGHTPVKTVTEHIVKNGDKTSHKLFFCDTHSLAYIPYIGTTFPIGDRTCLEISLEEQTSYRIINL